MAKCKYDIKRVPRELLEAFVDKANILRTDFDDEAFTPSANAIRRAACIPLKTRDQVNNELGELVRKYVNQQNRNRPPGVEVDYDLMYDAVVEGTKLHFCEAVREILEQPTEPTED